MPLGVRLNVVMSPLSLWNTYQLFGLSVVLFMVLLSFGLVVLLEVELLKR